MRCAGIWPQLGGRLKSRFRQGKPGRRMVAKGRIRGTLSIHELVVSLEKGRVSCHGLIQKLNRVLQAWQITRTEVGCDEQSLGPSIKIESGQIGGGRFFDRC